MLPASASRSILLACLAAVLLCAQAPAEAQRGRATKPTQTASSAREARSSQARATPRPDRARQTRANSQRTAQQRRQPTANLRRTAAASEARATAPRGRKVVGPTADPASHLPGGKAGRIVFGVMGGAGAETPAAVAEKLSGLGAAIAETGGVVLTGAAQGLPDIAVRAARKKGGLTIGVSPWRTMKAHRKARAPENFDVIKLTYHPALRGQTRPNFMGREIDNIEHSDVIIIAGGRFGTLGELAIALDERKVVGVLTGTGGITGEVKRIIAASTRAGKPPGAPVVYDSNPQRLVQKLIAAKAKHDASGQTGPLGDY